MVYPIVVSDFASLVLIGMLLFLVPVFVKIFAQLNGQLPTLTQFVVDASNVLRDYWFIIFPLHGGSGSASAAGRGPSTAARSGTRFKLRIPMKIGDIVLKVTMARFSRTLSTLVGCRRRHRQGARDHRQHLGQLGRRAGAHRGAHEGARGGPDRPAADREPGVPADGQPDDQDRRGDGRAREDARKVADFYEDEVETSINALTSIIEPITMIGVGVMVGIIVIAMYLPMFKMLKLVTTRAASSEPQRPRIASARSGTRASPRCLPGSGSSPSSIPRMLTQRSFERATCQDARGQRSSAFLSFHEARWSGASSRSTAAS